MSHLTNLLDQVVQSTAPEIKKVMREKIDAYPGDVLDKILKAYIKDLLREQEAE